jgi:flavorubredoxin
MRSCNDPAFRYTSRIMTTTNTQSGTTLDEIAAGIYRISTPLPPTAVPGGFSFNQYLIVDEEPLLFHTGPRRMFPLVREAIAQVMPVERLRWISFSHYEADECGALNELLAVAPRALPLCGRVAAQVSINDVADRPAVALADGEARSLGGKSVVWFDTPHVPHAWECGFLLETTTRTLLCGDLFTQPGSVHPALTEGDILGPSEAFRHAMDYYSHSKHAPAHLERLAQTQPRTLACMHGSAWQGDGGALLRALATALHGSVQG